MKTYAQYCGVAKALDVVGERWTLLVIRDLLVGPCRYSELLASLEGITTNLLASRLKHLQASGLVEKQTSMPGTYALTSRGRDLEPVVLALGGFGMQVMGAPTKEDRFNPRWAMLSIQRLFLAAGGAPDGYRADVQFVVGGAPFYLQLRGHRASVRQGALGESDVMLRSELSDLAAGFFRGESFASLVRSGAWQVEGNKAMLKALVSIVSRQAAES